MNDDLKIKIKTKLYTVTGKISPTKIKQYKLLWDDVIKATSFLPSDTVCSERVYCVLNDITERPLCPISKQPVRWSPQRKEYRTAVGTSNSNKLIDRDKSVIKFRNTISTNKTRIREDFWTHYNTNNYTLIPQKDIIKIAIEKITQQKSNYFRPHDLESQKDLICSIIHYTDNGLLKGVKTPCWAERLYLIANNMTEPPRCVDDTSIKQFFENTKKGFRKYSTNYNKIDAHIKNIITPAILSQGFTVLNECNNLKTNIFVLKCNKCSEKHSRELTGLKWKSIYCSGCFGNSGTSKAEYDIIQFIKSVHPFNIIQSDWSILGNREIDIYIPEKKLAIEYNGVLWHSYGTKYPNNIISYERKKFHIHEKTKRLLDLGINVLNIYDTDWNNKQDETKKKIIDFINNPVTSLTQKTYKFKQCKYKFEATVNDLKDAELLWNQGYRILHTC